MNQKIILLLSAIFIFSNVTLSGNNDSTLIITINEETVKVEMDLEINGIMKLYSVLKADVDEEKIIEYATNDVTIFTNWVLNPDRDFYISIGNNTEIITPSNFKRLAKKYFTATPELAQKIGKRGFRYKNLPSMILYYNKAMANQGGLTKQDVIASY